MKQSRSHRPLRLGLMAAALAIAPMLSPDTARADIPDALYTALGQGPVR